MMIETIHTNGGTIEIEQLDELDENGNGFRVHSPYESQSVETLEDAREVAAEMEEILNS